MNEIVTYGQNYKLTPGIKVIVQSAKKINCTLTVIGVNLESETKKYLKDNNVNIVDGCEIAEKHNVNLNLSPYTLKVIFFNLYAKKYTKSKNLYMCDFTDLFFQKDVFELIKSDKTYVTSENKVIGTCQTNSTWVNICYNQDIFNLLKNKDILNGGSVLGSRQNCIYLLDEMCKDMGSIISRIGNYQNIDQASLNKVVYFDEYNYRILNNGEILNAAHSGDSIVEKVDVGYKIDNNIPYVLHQYDVIKQVEKELYEKYSG